MFFFYLSLSLSLYTSEMLYMWCNKSVTGTYHSCKTWWNIQYSKVSVCDFFLPFLMCVLVCFISSVRSFTCAIVQVLLMIAWVCCCLCCCWWWWWWWYCCCCCYFAFKILFHIFWRWLLVFVLLKALHVRMMFISNQAHSSQLCAYTRTLACMHARHTHSSLTKSPTNKTKQKASNNISYR